MNPPHAPAAAQAVGPRILFVSAVSEFKGGAEVVLRTMLANPHIQPVLATPAEGAVGEAAAAMGIPVCYYRPDAMMNVHRPPRPGPIIAAAFDAVRCAFRLRHLAREHGCDLLHSNGLKPHMLCAILGLATRTRTLVHLHDIPYTRAERLIWRLIARCVNRVIMVSRPCFPGDVLPANVQVVQNGIAMVSPDLPPERAPGPLRLGFVGRFHPNKGLDVLVDWFAAVRRRGLDAILIIRGRPDPEKPEYWEHIQARLRDEGLEPWARKEGWTTGAATYAGLDLLLLSSKTPDPAPLVVPEAMSAGVIVAGYPAGGIPTMIDQGRTGLLVKDGDSLATQLRALLDKPDAMSALRGAAFAHVQANFSVAGFHERLAAVYASMLPGPRTKAA